MAATVTSRRALELREDPRDHLDTVVADLAFYPIEPGRWDGIVSIWRHLPSARRAAVHQQVVVGLKIGGVFLLEAYTPARLVHGTGGPKDADLLPTLAGLREELAGPAFVHAEERDRLIHEGPGHAGLSAVVQVVARRRG